MLGAALLGLLGGCAARMDPVAAERGPAFLVEGRLSARQPGRQALIAGFSWSRGYGPQGWREGITLTGPGGQRILRVRSDHTATVVTSPAGERRVGSLDELLRSDLGMHVAPATLAGWLAGEHDGGPMPDKARAGETVAEVLERASDGRPTRLRILHRGAVVLLAVSSFS